jgi:hypothetical protein
MHTGSMILSEAKPTARTPIAHWDTLASNVQRVQKEA